MPASFELTETTSIAAAYHGLAVLPLVGCS